MRKGEHGTVLFLLAPFLVVHQLAGNCHLVRDEVVGERLGSLVVIGQKMAVSPASCPCQ